MIVAFDLTEQHSASVVYLGSCGCGVTCTLAGNTPNDLADLPTVQTRTAKDVDVARNFMTNTVDTIFGHYNRILLVESSHRCQSAEDLHKVFPSWRPALESHSSSKKRLPEMIEKLFAVL